MNRLLKISIFIIAICIIMGVLFRDKIYRIHFALTMFSGKEQVERFRTIEDYFPTQVIETSGQPSLFHQGVPIDLPLKYNYQGQLRNTKDLLADTDVTGLLVLHNDTILYENYYRGNTAQSHTIGWSVTKSFVSALMGIAIADNAIKGIEDLAIDYLPELKGTAYETVSIKNLLQMSSGVSWSEDYSDFSSDINRFGRTLALGGSFTSFLTTLSKDKSQGTYNRYNSSDTQVLGMIISNATKQSLANYLEHKIWKPLGMENKAWWMVDDQGNEFAAAGLSASLRDFGRFGLLYLNNGFRNGQQIIPAAWVKQSLTADAPHLQPGENKFSNNEFGYGYQWWLFDSNEGEYAALGIYNQLIYVNPTHQIVIVKSSANNNYGQTNDESSFREQETIELLRAIVKQVLEAA